MPRISVVVPIYNVERYVGECLRSIAAQTVTDLEVIVVDDGSTDGSRAIAEEFAASDPRFRVVAQPNGGLGNARNTGTDAASGEFLAYVDGDDALTPNAYELLIGALEETGSDFATGNVHYLTRTRTRQAPFLEKTFTKTRKATHVTRFRALLVDRIVPNKLWRRSFWDEQGFRHPEGMLHEDIPVVVPAHFAARSVDVISQPVYLYRQRDDGELSITQRRSETRALQDRLKAIEHVSEHLAKHGPAGWKLKYDASVVADDLRAYADVLAQADDAYRSLFLDRVNEYLDGIDDRAYDDLPAIERLKWHLVRRRLMPELLEVQRFQREELDRTRPVCVDGHWYGDYPFRTDERLAIPASVYDIDAELELKAHLERLDVVDGALVAEGWTAITGVGAPAPDTHEVSVTAVPRDTDAKGRFGRPPSPVELDVSLVERPDVTARTLQQLADLRWSGFRARLDPRALRKLGGWQSGVWELHLRVRAGKLERRTSRFATDNMRMIGPVPLPASRGVEATALLTAGGVAAVDVRTQWATVTHCELEDGDVLVLSGDERFPRGAAPAAELVLRKETVRLEPERARGRFSVRVPLARLQAAAAERDGEERAVWALHLGDGEERQSIGLAVQPEPPAWTVGGRELSLAQTPSGGASIVEARPRPVVTSAEWLDDGSLELAGRLSEAAAGDELVLTASQRDEEHAFALERLPGGGFRSRLTPARIASLAGDLPLRADRWQLWLGSPAANGADGAVRVDVAAELDERLPLTTTVAHKPFAFGMTRTRHAVLLVRRDLDPDESGAYNQRRLPETVYVAARSEPLRDLVVYMSFRGWQCSDSPRAIYEELVRRGARLEHAWVVRDGMASVPGPAGVLREGSREHHEALGRARFVVANDRFPGWFERRPDQTGLQTWHGTPLKRLGRVVDHQRREMERSPGSWERELANWQHVISPSRFSTSVLRSAYAFAGDPIEAGLPRNDVLARPDGDTLTKELRTRIGVPEGARTVLYAPTYRDHRVDAQGRRRIALELDLEGLSEALGPETIVLFRKHPHVPDTMRDGGPVRDVSAYPECTELLLAADVLVTDYSSVMFDFANTGRPMLFLASDADAFVDESTGLDYAATVPGPVLRSTDEVAEALLAVDAVRSEYAPRYDAFRREFCPLDDGRATERVVERVFAEVL